MTSIREAIRRLIGKQASPDRAAYEFSFAVYWTRTVRVWTYEQRSQIAAALETLFSDPGFDPQGLQNMYTIKMLAGTHGGASLTALAGVLEAYRNDHNDKGSSPVRR